jgi:hypothetical protein
MLHREPDTEDISSEDLLEFRHIDRLDRLYSSFGAGICE